SRDRRPGVSPVPNLPPPAQSNPSPFHETPKPAASAGPPHPAFIQVTLGRDVASAGQLGLDAMTFLLGGSMTRPSAGQRTG
ncbi:MAG: hypothetical protein AB1762_13025, partial [Gemmatimonadota bacterium]